MTVLGYVVIEYNQASGAPELHTPYLCDDESEALIVLEEAEENTKGTGRSETFAIAEVVRLES